MNLADLIEANVPELAELESIDNGKPRAVSQGYDLPRCVQALRYMAGWATKLSGEHIEPSGYPAGAFHSKNPALPPDQGFNPATVGGADMYQGFAPMETSITNLAWGC
jgi:hypothetical protein